MVLNMNGGRRKQKWTEIAKVMQEEKIGIALLTETHLREDEYPFTDNNLEWEGINRMKGEKAGGGLGVMYDKGSHLKVLKRCKEHMWIKQETPLNSCTRGLVYMATQGEISEWNQEIYRCLQKDLTEINTNEPVMIVGDFNGHILEIDQREDMNGKQLKTFVELNNLNIGNISEKCKGKVTWQRNTQATTIDYIILNQNMDKIVSEIKIDDEGDLGIESDHNSIIITLENGSQYREEKERTPKRTIWNLEDEIGLEALANNLDLNEKIAGENKISYEAFTEVLEKTAKETVRMKKVGGARNKRSKKKWWDKEVQMAITKRKEACKKYRKIRKNGETPENILKVWNEYKEKKETAKSLVQRKRLENNKTLENIIGRGKDSAKKFWKYIKGKRKKENRSTEEHKGREHLDAEKIWKYMTESQQAQIDKVKKNPNITRQQNNPNTKDLRYPISMEEMSQTLRKAKNGKASGEDGLPIEFLKSMGDTAKRKLIDVLNEIMKENRCPIQWKTARVRLLYKGKKKIQTT